MQVMKSTGVRRLTVGRVADKLIWCFREWVWMLVAVGIVWVCASSASAQTTATNAVSLISDNVTNARNTLVPIAIAGLVLFLGIAAGLKFWRRVFKAVALMGSLTLIGAAQAQTTATNAVSLISDNVTNARDTLVPIAIGATVLFLGIAAGLKFWKRVFK